MLSVHMIAQSHLDPVFMWPWADGQAEALNTMSEAVRKLSNHKDLKFSCSSSLVHEWFQEFRPDKWKQLQRFVRQGRWVPVGGWYVQADTILPAGESLIRQALIGQRQFHDLTGKQSEVAYLVDSFGHYSTLGKIFSHCGYKYFTFGRPGEKFMKLPSSVFWWTGDDGSRLLCSRIPVRYSTYDDEILRISQAVELNDGTYEHVMCFFGLGDHGGGPTEEQIQRVKEFRKTSEAPDMHFSDPAEFFRCIENDENIPDFSGPLEPFAVGCYSAAISLKRKHDRAQLELLDAEKFITFADIVAGSSDAKSLEKLDDTWKKLLFTQFHDILPGSGVKEGLEHSIDLLGAVQASANSLKHAALTHLSREIDTTQKGYVHFVAFNNTARKRVVYLECEPWLFWQSWEKYRLLDSADNDVPQQRIPSAAAARALTRVLVKLELGGNGYEHLRVVGPEPDLSNFAITENCFNGAETRPARQMKSNLYTLRFDSETGTVKSIKDAKSGCNLRFGELCKAVSISDRSDTWTMHKSGYGRKGREFSKPTISMLESGPLRWSARVDRQLGNSKLTQEYRLYDESPVIEVRNRLEWNRAWEVCKFSIPNIFGKKARIIRGVAFGQSSAVANGNEFSFQNWLMIQSDAPAAKGKPFGIALLVGPGMHSADFTPEDGIRLTVVRSPVYCHEELADPYHPSVRHEHMEVGKTHEFVFGILPVFTPISAGELTEMSHCLTTGGAIITTDSHKGSLPAKGEFLAVDDANIAITACKLADDGDGIIVRLWETAGCDTQGAIWLAGQSIPFEIGKNAIKTLKIQKNSKQFKACEVNGIEQELKCI